MTKLFITATDTDAGKTYFAQLLIKSLVKHKNKVAVYKPVSAGCQWQNQQLVNEDAYLLQQQANCGQTLTEVNPIAYELPIAPHIAAKHLKQTISLEQIVQGYEKVCRHNADYIICEGAGGWRLPLGQGRFLSDFVKQSQQQVILVVNIKLGCLNHAVLSYESIIADGVNCLGWVANITAKNTDIERIEENIVALNELLPVPMLMRLHYQHNQSKSYLTSEQLCLLLP